MDISLVISEISQNKNIFKSLFENLSPEMYNWREEEGKWNLLEILCHLYDEEREDFRARANSVLENPNAELPPIDSQGWVISRDYASQNFEEKLNAFLAERDNSIAWLKSLQNPNWKNAFVHKKFGPLSAKMFLYNWLAHDYLHIRQIIRVKFEYFKNLSGVRFDYAGDW